MSAARHDTIHLRLHHEEELGELSAETLVECLPPSVGVRFAFDANQELEDVSCHDVVEPAAKIFVSCPNHTAVMPLHLGSSDNDSFLNDVIDCETYGLGVYPPPPTCDKVRGSATVSAESRGCFADLLRSMLPLHLLDVFCETDRPTWHCKPILAGLQAMLVVASLVAPALLGKTTTTKYSFLGLEQLMPGQTLLQLQQDCEDQRHEVWRWWTYQYTHHGVGGLTTNIVVLLVLGLPLEALHGHLFFFALFSTAVLLGGCAHLFHDLHRPLLGMSAGCYALLPALMGSLAPLCRRRALRLSVVACAITVGCATVLTPIFFHEAVTDDDLSKTSHAAHACGYWLGLFVGVAAGKWKKRSYDGRCSKWLTRALLLSLGTVQVVAVLAALGWTMSTWPPRGPLDATEPWCWSRAVSNVTLFGDAGWQCLRCSDVACINRWAGQLWLERIDPAACDELHYVV